MTPSPGSPRRRTTGSRRSWITSPGQGRIEIAKKIEAARDEGDLKENGGYHAAKEEQGKQEARILQLQHILENARVGEPPAHRGRGRARHDGDRSGSPATRTR